jgi:hypothetical protein
LVSSPLCGQFRRAALSSPLVRCLCTARRPTPTDAPPVAICHKGPDEEPKRSANGRREYCANISSANGYQSGQNFLVIGRQRFALLCQHPHAGEIMQKRAAIYVRYRLTNKQSRTSRGNYRRFLAVEVGKLTRNTAMACAIQRYFQIDLWKTSS